MSAMSATITPDRIVLMSDAAFYSQDGTLTDLATKALPVPGVPAVFCSRGVRAAFPFFQAACAQHRFAGWDDFVRGIDSVWSAFDKAMATIHPHSAQILLAAWSESRDRGEVLFRSLHAQYGLGARTTYVWAAPCHVAFGVDSDDLGGPLEFDPELDGIPAFEKSRALRNDLSCGSAANAVWGHSVGGWIDAVTISRDGVSASRRVHQWPDEIGRKIDPSAVPVADAHDTARAAA